MADDVAEEDSAIADDYQYWCFLSYRHADNQEQDRAWASWLHREIERYEVPAELVGTVNQRGETIPERIYPVFRDEESLAVSADLSESITAALDRSRYLVVLCSPRAVESRYVAEEIAHFKHSGKEDRILAAIIDGEPGDPDRQCFPESLRFALDDNGSIDASSPVEPIAADFRLDDGTEGYTSGEAYRSALLRRVGADQQDIKARAEAFELRLQLMKLKVLAGILGLRLETLRDRDKAYQLELAKRRTTVLRRWLTAVGALAVIAIVAGLLANDQRIRAERQEIAALRLAMQSTLQLAAQYSADGDLPSAATSLWRAAQLAHDIGSRRRSSQLDTRKAAELGRKIALLTSGWSLLPEEEGIRDFAVDTIGSHIVTLSGAGRLRLWQGDTGRPLSEAPVRLGDAERVAVSRDGTLVFAAGNRAVQEGTPLVLWQWDVSADTVDEVYFLGSSEEADTPTVSHLAADPDGNYLALQYLGTHLLKRAGENQFIEIDTGLNADSLRFSVERSAWLAKNDEAISVVDPDNGSFKTISEIADRSALALAATDTIDAIKLQAENDGRITATMVGGPRNGHRIGMNSNAAEEMKAEPFLQAARFGGNGQLIAIPTEARVNLYRMESGSAWGWLVPPAGRALEVHSLLPGDARIVAPASYGLDVWTPIPLGNTAGIESSVQITDDGETISIKESDCGPLQIPSHELREEGSSWVAQSIGDVMLWPDAANILISFGDLAIGRYRICPRVVPLSLRSHVSDPDSLDAATSYMIRTSGADLHLAAEPNGNHFTSWSEVGGVQLWNEQAGTVVDLGGGTMTDVRNAEFSRVADGIEILRSEAGMAIETYAPLASPTLRRRFPVQLAGELAHLSPPTGTALTSGGRPQIIYDPETGMVLARYFSSSNGNPAVLFSVPGARRIEYREENAIATKVANQIARISGRIWSAEVGAPVSLPWSDLKQVWRIENSSSERGLAQNRDSSE